MLLVLEELSVLHVVPAAEHGEHKHCEGATLSKLTLIISFRLQNKII